MSLTNKLLQGNNSFTDNNNNNNNNFSIQTDTLTKIKINFSQKLTYLFTK